MKVESLSYVSVTQRELAQLIVEGKLFVVLDACDEPAVLAKVDELGPETAYCLYRGDIDESLRVVAPFLVRMSEDLLFWLRDLLWKEPWGIFVLSRKDERLVRRSLRKFLVVKGPDSNPLYFRYYDPRVLPTFLDSCSLEDLAEFFGPIDAFGWCIGDEVVRFCWRHH